MKHHTMKRLCFLAVCMYVIPLFGKAQDTVHISLQDAETLFLKNNLVLLANRYNIDIAKAQVIQARLYNNPTLSLNGNIYNPQLGRFADISNKTGQYDIGIQQLVRLAGKRNKEIKMAEISVTLSENQFFDLVRTLRYSLRSEFFNISSLQNSIGSYGVLIRSLEQMSNAYDQLEAKGVVSLKDAVRIRSLLYSLRAEQAGLLNRRNESEASLQLLLQDNRTFFIADAENKNPPVQSSSSILSLVDTAYANRYDLKAAQTGLLLSRQNYSLQRALAKPNMVLGADFDKRGSFVENASFLTVAFDLPFFNRNQGNIRAAKYSIRQDEANVEFSKQAVENDVRKAYARMLNAEKTLQQIDPGFRQQSEKLLSGVTDNFRKKNISLVEFTDFYQSYKENIIQFNELQNEYLQAGEALNFAIGKTIFNQ